MAEVSEVDPRTLLEQVRKCRMMGSDFEEELDHALNALEAYEERSDTKGQATALCAVADAHLSFGGLAEALSAATDSLRLCRQSVDKMGEAAALLTLCKVHLLHIRADFVAAAVRELIPLLRDLGATWGETAVLFSIAEWRVAVARKGPAQAKREAAARLQVARDESQRWRVAMELLVSVVAELAMSSTKEGRRAMEVIYEAVLLFRALGAVWSQEFTELELLSSPTLVSVTHEVIEEHRQKIAAARENGNQTAEAHAQLHLACGILKNKQDASLYKEAMEAAEAAHNLCSTLGKKDGAAAALSLQAEACLHLRRIEEASAAATQAMRIFKDLVHRKGEASMLHKLAKVALLKKDSRTAKGVARTALALLRQLGERRSEAAVLMDLVQLAMDSKDLSEALRVGEEAGRLFTEVDDRRGASLVLNALAPVYLQTDSADGARRAAQSILGDLRELGDSEAEAAALKTLAKAQLLCSDAEEALKSAASAISLAGLHDDSADSYREELLPIMLQAHTECGQHSEALAMADEVTQYVVSKGDKVEEARVLAHLARSQLATGDVDAALATAQQALPLFRDLGSTEEQKLMLDVSIDCHLAKQDVSEAMSTAKQAVALFQRIGDHSAEQRAQQTVARVHIAKGEPTRAARIAKDAQLALREAGDIEGDAALLQVVVDAYLSKGDKWVDDALRVAGEGITVFNQLGNNHAKAWAYFALAKVQLVKDEFLEVLVSLREACRLFQLSGDRKQEVSALRQVLGTNWASESRCTPATRTQALRDAVTLCQDCEEIKLEAQLVQELLSQYLRQQQPDEALEVASKALKSLQHRGVKTIEMKLPLLMKLAEAHLRLGEFKAACAKANEALDLLHSSSEVEMPRAEQELTSLLISALSSSGDLAAAKTAASEALVKCQRGSDKAAEVRVNEALVEAHLTASSKESLAAGLKLAKATQAVCKDLGDVRGEAQLLTSTASILLKQGERKEAKKAAKEALTVYVKTGDREGQAQVHALLAKVGKAERNFAETQSSALEALRLFKDMVGRQHDEAKCVKLLVEARLDADQAPDALRAAKEAQARFNDLGYAKGEALAWELVASAHLAMEAPKSCQLATKSALAIHKKAKDKKSEAKALVSVVSALLMSEDVDDALRAAKDAKRLFGELGDKQGEAEASESMVSAYAAQGQGAMAIQSAKEAAAGFAATKCIQRQAAAMQLVASLHQQMEDPSQAAWTAHEAVSLFRVAGDKGGEAWALHTAAEAHLMKLQTMLDTGSHRGRAPSEEIYDAIQAAKQAKTLFKQDHDMRGEQAAEYVWARGCALRGDVREAARHAEEMLRLAQRAGEKQNQGVACLLCANCYLQNQNYTSARRKAEEAAVIFNETGDTDGLQGTQAVLEQVAEFQEVKAANAAGRGHQFQRKAFPWNSAQQEARNMSMH